MFDSGQHQANTDAANTGSAAVEGRTGASEGAAAPDIQETLDSVLGRTPGRPRGHPKTGGRKPGSKNKRTMEVEAALRPLVPKAKRKLKALMDADDDKVAYSACMGVLSYVFGKPIDRKEIAGAGGAPLIDAELYSQTETARRLAFVLARGAVAERELAEADAPAPRPDPEPETTTEAPEPPAEPTEPALPKHAFIYIEEGERERSGERAWLAMEGRQVLKTFHGAGAREAARGWIATKYGNSPCEEIEVPLPDEEGESHGTED